jgi:hypothetical protein
VTDALSAAELARAEMVAAGYVTDDSDDYPTDVYPAELQHFIDTAATDIGCPVNYLAAGILPVAGAAIGGKTTVYIGGQWSETPAVWLALVGQPGVKKTPAMKALLRPLWKIDDALNVSNLRHLEAWERDDPKTRGTPPAEAHAVVVDTTIEALCDTLAANHQLAMYADELTGWVASFNQYREGGRDRQHWLSIWSSAPFKVQRKSKRISQKIPEPFISVLGGIQPALVSQFAGDDGLFPRLLYAHGAPTLSGALPAAGEGNTYTEWQSLVRTLWDRPGAVVDLARDARGYADAWYREQEELAVGNDGGLGEVHSKMLAYGFRFALILNQIDAVYDKAGPITVDQMDRAVRLVEWFTTQAKEAARHDDRSNVRDIEWADKLVKMKAFIEEHPGCTRKYILQRGPRWARRASELDKALDDLGVKMFRPND